MAGAHATSMTKLSGRVISDQVVAKVVHIHPLFALRREDLPKDLQIEGGDDDRLYGETDYYEKLDAWLSKHFKGDVKTNPTTRRIFLPYATLWEDPELTEKFQDFVLAHEVAHLFHEHRGWDVTGWEIAAALTCGALLLLGELSLSVAASAFLIAAFALHQFHLYISRKEEYEADLSAYKILKDLDGAEAACMMFQFRRDLAWGRFSMVEKFLQTLCPFSTHPTPDARIAALRAATLEKKG